MNLVLSVFAAVLNSLWLVAIAAALVWLVLRVFNAATRFVIWWVALAVVLALPAAPAMRTWWRARVQTPPAATARPFTAPVSIASPIDDPPVIVTLKQDHFAKWPLGIAALWALLSLYRLGQIGRSYFYLHGVKRRASVSPQSLPELARRARLLISNEIASPMATGFLRPAVILPASLREEITPQELDHVLLHEAAHLARRDDWTNLIARLLGAVLALHPVALWILWQIDRERETACDDWVVAKTGAARPYAASLARMVELRSGPRGEIRRGEVSGEALAPGIFGGGSRLGGRIEMLLKRGREFSPQASAARVGLSAVVLLALVIAGSLTPRWIAFAQTPARPSFEVASVRPTPPDTPSDKSRVRPSDGLTAQQLSSGTLAYSGIVLMEYIELAYGLKDYQISKQRPKDLYERYDIAAKTGGPVPAQQMKLMLQTLLEDRFKLKLQLETKELPVYDLVVAKNGPKFGHGKDDGKSGVSRLSGTAIEWHNTSMEYLADWITPLPSLGRPVLDRTGLVGAYDFTLTYEGGADKDSGPAAVKAGLRDAVDASILGALQELGLKLETDKAPIEFVTIEHVERPDAN
jgi:uncharacterized protein (TIGR03435 family)